MLKNVSNSFKTACNSISFTYSEYVVLNEVMIPIKASLKDDCYENGNFIGSFIFKEIKFETDNQYDFKNKEFEYYKVVNGESIKIGTFITTEVEDNDTKKIMKVIGMDYGLKSQVEYKSTLNYDSGIITLLDVWNEACQLSGLESGIEDFENSDFIVTDDQFTGTGATIRDVFKAIALSSGSFVKVMNDDKIYLVFNETTTDIIEDYTDLEDKRDTHPITCLRIGMSQVTGNDVEIKDDELVEQYGENWLVINDNPFAYTLQKRQQLIEAIFNKVKGFGYSAFVSKTAFKPYLTCGDLIKFRNRNGQLINSILLRYEHNYDSITLQAPSETSATVNYVRPQTEIDVIKRTEIIVDQNTGDINLLTQRTSSLENNTYTKEQTNELVQNASTGITNTFSEAGGNNVFRNTGLWFGPDTTTEEKEASSTNGKIEIDDGADNTLSNLKIYGNTSQEGTPTPDSPVNVNVVTGEQEIVVCGKNLFDKDKISIGYLKENGTLSIDAAYRTSNFIPVQPNTTYYKTQTLSPRTKFYDANKQVLNNSTYKDISIGGNAGTFTTPNNAYYLRLSFPFTGSSAINVNTIMVKEGTDTTYEPYIGNSYPISLGVENLWKNQLTGFLPQSGSYPTTNSTYPNARYILIDLLAGQSITLSGSTSAMGRVRYIDKDTNQVVGMINNRETEYYKSTGTYVGQFTEGTITAKKDFIVGIMDMGGAVNNLIVNYGTTPQTISDNPIELCKIGDYQDRIYKDNGKWYLKKEIGKVVLDGSDDESWGKSGASTSSIFVGSTNITNAIDGNGLSNLFTYSSQVGVGCFTIYNNGANLRLCVDNNIISTIEAFKTWLSTHNTIVYYVLKEPTTTEITDNELINQLNSIKTIDGYNLILLASNDVDTEFDITYLIDFTYYEYWTGDLGKIKEEKAANLNALLLQHGTVYQEQQVPNGSYTISFKYKKLINLANVKCIINDVEYELTANDDTEFTQTIDVSAQHIRVTFTSDRQNSCEIYDLMVNAGKVKLAYSQNQNETTTDTVNISKGITITSTDTDTTFKANADGIRTLDRNGNVLTKFTDTGMTTKEMIVEDTSQIVGVLVQQVGDQTWFTRL